jgi:3-deoxy-D-manno-octulosonic-acid transferase
MLFFYRCLTSILTPALIILIYFRSIIKKEDRQRFKEKIFSSSFKVTRNTSKRLIWFHAASIGEVVSILPLIEEINNSYKNIEFLITSVTLSSAKLLEKKIKQNKNITHRFFPLDLEHLVKKFLQAWKPNLICFVESEVWPNFLFKIKKAKIPLVLINGRITKKTFNRWNLINSFAKKVFNTFDLCIAASEESKNNLKKLKVKNLIYIGNLKFSVKNRLGNLNGFNRKILDRSKVWCAASTHDEEENIILKTHLKIKKKYKNTLTIIVPRHITRCSYIKKLSDKFNLNSQILNDKDSIKIGSEILIINSFGVLSKYFNYCQNIFIGKSFVKKLEHVGGQNPIEAAKLGCKIFYGPYVYNFKEVYDFLCTYNISEQVKNEKELALKIIKNFKFQNQVNKKQINLLNTYGEKILSKTITELKNFI